MTQDRPPPIRPLAHTVVKYLLVCIWWVIAPNYAWEMWHGGQDLLHPLNMVMAILVVVGPITAFLGSWLRMVSALAGIALASISTYFSWPIWFLDLGEDTSISIRFWGLEFVDRDAQLWSAGQTIALMTLSFVGAYVAAMQLEKPAQLSRAET